MALTRDDIAAELAKMEEAKGVRTLFAAESGSRCWGFASPDSDYDVRFVYARPLEDYLRLGKLRDTIEWRLDDVYDVAGWDIAKFLRLLRGSNPSAFEWLASPIVYTESPEFSAVRGLAPGCFNPVASVHHYHAMAKADWHAMTGDAVKLKKYLYVMRALLAAKWAAIQRVQVPMLFSELCDSYLQPAMKPVVDALLVEKAAACEADLRPRIPKLDAWIAASFLEVEELMGDVEPVPKLEWEPLDAAFCSIVCSKM